MTKEIGGYMELEPFTGEEYYPSLLKLNLGRTALIYLLQILPCERIFIPRYICNSVIDAAETTGCETCLYALDENLLPVLPADTLGENDWVYIVNYYGQLSAEQIRSLNERYHLRVILDNAQAFYQEPIDEIPCIYTCRKFFGVSDGAYLYTARSDSDSLPRDHSAGRMGHLLGRAEQGARSHYAEMLSVSETFSNELPRGMSAVTENILRGIDYAAVRKKRAENYALLKALLPSDNPFTRRDPAAPFAYPYYHPDGIHLRRRLAEENIFVPTNWSYLLEIVEQDRLEYDWSANILPLPIDQRYGESEMHQIADAISRLTAQK